MLCGGKTHTAHYARVRHAWDARLEAGRVSGVGEFARGRQPLTRGPEASDTSRFRYAHTARPAVHISLYLERRRHSAARALDLARRLLLPAATQGVRSALSYIYLSICYSLINYVLSMS